MGRLSVLSLLRDQHVSRAQTTFCNSDTLRERLHDRSLFHLAREAQLHLRGPIFDSRGMRRLEFTF